ncbi:MAG: hypothetical protein AB3N16_06635 [Flavobacteriaceae bacterium]
MKKVFWTMVLDGLLPGLSKDLKLFVATFVVVLSIGFFTGLGFVRHTNATTPSGIEENYLGNEEIEEVEVMRFKKSEREMLTIIHSHILSMSLIFFVLGILVWMTRLPRMWKLFLTIEPFVSIILTFGGIYFLWKGLLWMRYVVLFSGAVMTLSFTASVLAVFLSLWGKPISSHRTK